MKIVVFELESWERTAFEELAEEHELVTTEEPLSAENAGEYAGADVISTFIYSDLDRETLSKLEGLKLISTRSTGVDHIDHGYCEERDIRIANVPSYGENTVAEHVFGLLLLISHNLWNAVDRTRKGDFSLQGLRGFDLRGKTIGVVGTGAIGRHVVEIAQGFGMTVIAHDIQPDEDFARERGFEYLSLDDLLERSDVVTLHVPATEETKGLIGPDQFGRIKRGAVLINTARGAVVDVHALLRALADGRVRAAGLDVLPEEPVIREEAELLRSVFQKEHDLETLLADHVLLRMRNVFITPHSAFDTTEAVNRILETTVENIAAFCKGEERNLVTA